jgi:outer membrane protein assembly factor BamB
LKTGARRWIAYHPSLTHGSPTYINALGLVVIGSNNGITYAYDSTDGTLKWSHQSGGDIKTAPAFYAENDLVLTPSADGTLYALRASDGSVAWAHATAGIYSTPRVIDGAIYLASLDKHLYRLDAHGHVVWSLETRGRIFASPILAEDSIWIGSNDGRVYEVNPNNGMTRGFHQLSERVVNAIAYAPQTQRFFVPTVANEMYCFERAQQRP